MCGSGTPPDPSLVAPAINRTHTTSVFEASRFLYDGDNALQLNVEPDAIKPRRVAVLRGQVTDLAGAPLPAVEIKVLHKERLGYTRTRMNGAFDIVVNGGGPVIIDYHKEGYLPIQRQMQVPWQSYVPVPPVVMTPLSEEDTLISSDAVEIQVAEGESVSDDSGTRQARVFVTPGTVATLILPDGSTQELTEFIIRATEYTVGDQGPEAMPGSLPPTSAYTYAIEYSLDEAIAVNATRVEFNQPVISYNENLLGFTVGGAVPVGYYDREEGFWVPEDNGRVIEILSVDDGRVELDIDGSGSAANEEALTKLGITDGELEKLAELYDAGESLWRVPLTHFTPVDCNWPGFNILPDHEGGVSQEENTTEKDDCRDGSIIECNNQILRENLGIAGTPFNLHYHSGRVPGRKTPFQISLTGDSVSDMIRVDLQIEVGGRLIEESFEPVPNLFHEFQWDGRDAYGRLLQGAQEISIRVGHVYIGTYSEVTNLEAQAFGLPSNTELTTNVERREYTAWRTFTRSTGLADAKDLNELGGWSLSVHHAYDPGSQTLFRGSGGQKSADANALAFRCGPGSRVDHNGACVANRAEIFGPQAITSDAAGALYFIDYIPNPTRYQVSKIDEDGVLSVLAGGARCTVCEGEGDGGLAEDALFKKLEDIAVDSSGNIYVSDSEDRRVRKIDTNGVITTVLGGGDGPGIHDYISCDSSSFNYDPTECFIGKHATDLTFSARNGSYTHPPKRLDVDSQGNLYVITNDQILKVSTSGVVAQVAGCADRSKCVNDYFIDDGDLATSGKIYNSGSDIAVDAAGNIYYVDSASWPGGGGNSYLRRIDANGILDTLAHSRPRNEGPDLIGERSQAIHCSDRGTTIQTIVLDRNGGLFIQTGQKIVSLSQDGQILDIAGNCSTDEPSLTGYLTHNMNATSGKLYASNRGGFTVTPSQEFYLAYSPGQNYGHIARIGSVMPSYDFTELLVYDESLIHTFTSEGQHLYTTDSVSGLTLFSFEYDAEGRLISVVDVHGLVTSIERNADGEATSITGPYGHQTLLSLDENGYLSSLLYPDGQVVSLSHGPLGLLESLIEPAGHAHTYEYDEQGRVIKDTNPAGGFTALEREIHPDGTATVTATNSLGESETFYLDGDNQGAESRIHTTPSGVQIISETESDGSSRATALDGTVSTARLAPDPRFGMQMPITAESVLTLPSGLSRVTKKRRAVTLEDPDDLLSVLEISDEVEINGQISRTIYDAVEKTITSQSPQRRTSVSHLNDMHQVTQFDPPGNGMYESTYTTYDDDGRVTSTSIGTGASARTMTLTYDDAGRLETVTDPLGDSATFTYDAGDQMRNVTGPDGAVITMDYDANGNLIALTPPGQPAHTFTYNNLNLVESYTPPEGVPVTTLYDGEKRPISLTRADGQVISYTYDTAGRPATIVLPRGNITFVYDELTGKLMSSTSPDNVTLSVEYDGMLPTEVAWSGAVTGTLTHTFDRDFALTERSINGEH